MIIACGVLSCVAVLLGIIILEIALDKRKKARSVQEKQTSSVEKPAEETAQASDTHSVPETPVKEPEIPAEPVAEPIIAEEPAPAEETVAVEEAVEDEPVADDEPVSVIEPASEPVIEEAPVHAEPVHVAETIIAEEPVEVIKHEIEEEPVQTEDPVVAEEPAVEEDDTAEFNGVEDPDDEVASELKVVVKDGQTRYIVIKYSRSFQAKLIQSPDETKRYYSELKNCLESYGVKSRMSWKWEAFRSGRKTLARIRLRGKTLSIVLALNPDDYKDTKYLVESVADVACYADTPCLYRLRSERRLKYVKELIAKLMQDNGLTQKPDAEVVDYAAQYPYDTTEALIGRKLIKVLTDEEAQSGEVFKPSDIRKSVKAQDVDNILQDEIAAELIEKLDGVSDKTKSGIINIDTLSQNFKDGETVTIEEIRKRIKGYNKVTYIKVLARGTLDKRLIVEADDFSLQAVKMIALLGGKIIKK